MKQRRAVALGLLADALLGEPPMQPHPVALFGRAVRRLEGRTYRDTRVAGATHAAAGVGLGVGAGALVGSTTVATYVAVAGRALWEAAGELAIALDRGEVDEARRLAPALVGRDPDVLDEKELARAAVESVAENTVDAVVAPALWAALAGAPGALGCRAVNTLDAIVGHRSLRYQRFGWASARLDDAAAFVPARVTAALVAVVRPRSARAVWDCVRRDAPAHPSPNSGVAEAAFAAALGLRLGGESQYGERIEVRPPLGTGRPAEVEDIGRAVRLSQHVTAALAAGLAIR